MVLLRLTPAAMSRCRFAISPLAETIGALIALQRPCAEPWLAGWHAGHRMSYVNWLKRDPVAAALLPLAAATARLPEVLALAPTNAASVRLEDELAAVAARSDDDVRSIVANWCDSSKQAHDYEWLALDGLGPRIAQVLEHGWDCFVAPDWQRRRAVLERDIAHRTRLFADHGLRHVVETLERGRVWVEDDEIQIDDRNARERWTVDDGLVFVPRTTSGAVWTVHRPRHAIVYPASGVAAADPAQASDALSTLLGAGRARVVCELVRPATSSQLAAILDVSFGTVSAHLAVLREANVVAGTRAGRHVIYRLTDRGKQLLTLLAGLTKEDAREYSSARQ